MSRIATIPLCLTIALIANAMATADIVPRWMACHAGSISSNLSDDASDAEILKCYDTLWTVSKIKIVAPGPDDWWVACKSNFKNDDEMRLQCFQSQGVGFTASDN